MQYTNDWGIQPNTVTDTNPFGREIQNFMFSMPQYAVYFRKDPRFMCPKHYSESDEAPIDYNEFCPQCWGLGLLTKPQLVACKLALGEAQLSIRETDSRLEPGYAEYNTAQVYFPRNVRPKLEDFLVFCEWNKPSQLIPSYPIARPTKITNIYLIKVVNNDYEREMGFVTCGLEKSNYTLDRFNKSLPHLTSLQLIQPEVWPCNQTWSTSDSTN